MEKQREFFDFVEENGLQLVLPPVGDGSLEIDDKLYGWGWGRADWAALMELPVGRIWTVIDGDSEMVVTQGVRRVNRVFYIVLDKDIDGIQEDFIY